MNLRQQQPAQILQVVPITPSISNVVMGNLGSSEIGDPMIEPLENPHFLGCVMLQFQAA